MKTLLTGSCGWPNFLPYFIEMNLFVVLLLMSLSHEVGYFNQIFGSTPSFLTYYKEAVHA
ncbi:MAG: hypothetical protein HP490_11110 [Nitrospira sp.]|nr:hypothetical protein [Nitrospira sp.]